MSIKTSAPRELIQIFEKLGIALDISEYQHNEIVTNYKAVADWLASPASPLARYKPEIAPQGSFLLGTMIQASRPGVEIDIDLVCKLLGKDPAWTQFDLKKIVGDRLRAHGTYIKMLGPEGRRCWTLHYADDANFHLDVLPALVANDYEFVLERALAFSGRSSDKLGISITDKTLPNYRTERAPEYWPSSNPFGYAIWFHDLARRNVLSAYSLKEIIKPVPTYQTEKTPLQRVVQLLKWHRDQRFADDPEKPISIIITTLAARAYAQERDVLTAFVNVAEKLSSMIETRFDSARGRWVRWVPNPVNPAENFADKWVENPHLEEKFNAWIHMLDEDIENIFRQVGQGFHKIKESMEKPFGVAMVNRAFEGYGHGLLKDRESGVLKMAGLTGILGQAGRTTVSHHNNFGADE